MIRSLRAIVVVILVAIMGVWSASTHAASAAGSGVGMPAYNYDSGPVGSASSRAHDERGPPVTAVDDCLHAVTTAPRFGGLVTRAYTYDHPERHVYTNIATLSGQAPPATVGQLVRKGDFVSGFVVAAKSGGGLIRLSSRESWANPKTLGRHFRDHGADFGATSADDYAAQASGFLQRGGASQLPTKIGSDGTIRMYDSATNTFGSYRADGLTKTFFKPTSPNYWQTQPGVLQ